MQVNLLITIFLFLSGFSVCHGQAYESCSFTAEEAWNGDTAAMKKFLATCGKADTVNLDENNKRTKKSPHHQMISLLLNNGKIIYSDSVFFVVEEMPQFPGKDAALYNYLSANLKYPVAAREHKTEGRVFISFIIERNGNVSHTKVQHGIGNGCDEEALRVIRQMQPWIPGTMHGKPIRVQYSLPVKFTLAEK